MTPTFEQVYAFLKANYRPSRFHNHWDTEKATRVTQMYIDDLEKFGVGHVSRHEDIKGQGFKFTNKLEPIYGIDVEYPLNLGKLTHLF